MRFKDNTIYKFYRLKMDNNFRDDIKYCDNRVTVRDFEVGLNLLMDKFITWLYTDDCDVYIEVKLKDNRVIEGKITTILNALENVCVYDVCSMLVEMSYSYSYCECKYVFDAENNVIKEIPGFDSDEHRDMIEYGE